MPETEALITKFILNAEQYLKTLDSIEKELKKQSKTQKKMETDAEKAEKARKKHYEKWLKSLSDVTAAYHTLSAGVKTAYRALDATMERAQKFAGLQKNNTLSIEAARESTKGLIDDMSLLEAANMSTAFKLGFTAEQFADLSKSAVIASQKLGGDVNEAMTKLMVGLARQSKLRLDDLGIILDTNKAYEAHAKVLGVNVDKLTDAEKRTAFMNEALKKLNEITKDGEVVVAGAAGAWAQFKNSMSNAYDAVSASIGKSSALKQEMTMLSLSVNAIALAFGKITDSTVVAGHAMAIFYQKYSWLIPGGKKVASSLTQTLTTLRSIQAVKKEVEQLQKDINKSEMFSPGQSFGYGEAPEARPGKKKKGRRSIPGSAFALLEMEQDINRIVKERAKQREEEAKWLHEQVALDKERREAKFDQLDFEKRALEVKREQIRVDEEYAAKKKAEKKALGQLKGMVASRRSGIEALPGMDAAGQILGDQQFKNFIANLDNAGVFVQNFASVGISAMDGFSNAMVDGFAAALAGEESWSNALKASLKVFLQSMSKMALIESMKNTAKGIVALFEAPGAAAGYFASAALWGGVAAAAGVGSAQISVDKKKTTGRAGVSRGLGGAATSGTGGGGGSNTFVYNINTLLPPREDEAAIMVASLAKRASHMMGGG